MIPSDVDKLHQQIEEFGLTDKHDAEYAHQLIEETAHTFRQYAAEVQPPSVTPNWADGEFIGIIWVWAVAEFKLEITVPHGSERLTYRLCQLEGENEDLLRYATMEEGWLPTSSAPALSTLQLQWWDFARHSSLDIYI